MNDCVDDPCQHDGTCDDHENGFTCRCLPGYTGRLCTEIIVANNSITNATYVAYELIQDQSNNEVCRTVASVANIAKNKIAF